MNKRYIKYFIYLIGMFLILSNTVFANEIAKPTKQKIFLNSEEVKCEVYNVNGNNYFKLRDIAAILNETTAHFSVEYDGNIHIKTNNKYTFVGNELSSSKNEEQVARETSVTIYINGVQEFTNSYSINGNNYFAIRYLGDKLGFSVEYDSDINAVLLVADELIEFDIRAVEKEDSSWVRSQKFKDYRNAIKDAQSKIKKLYTIIKTHDGKSKTKEQTYAYIALNSWLVEDNADNISFVKLDLDNLKSLYGITLPIIEGLQGYNNTTKSDYYLTSNGTVFIYPPYYYNENLYVTDKVKIKENDIVVGGKKIIVDDILKSRYFDDMPIFEEEDSNVKIITNFNTNLTLDKNDVLEFSFRQYNYPGVSLIVEDIDLRNDVITADVTCGGENIMKIDPLYPYSTEDYANISTGQIRVGTAYHNKVLEINFYRNGELFASGKIKIIE